MMVPQQTKIVVGMFKGLYREEGMQLQYIPVHLAKFKPKLKIVTLSTENIGDQLAKVTKYSNNYTIVFEFC